MSENKSSKEQDKAGIEKPDNPDKIHFDKMLLKELVWKLDREVWAHVPNPDPSEQWSTSKAREESSKIIAEYIGNYDQLRKESEDLKILFKTFKEGVAKGDSMYSNVYWDESELTPYQKAVRDLSEAKKELNEDEKEILSQGELIQELEEQNKAIAESYGKLQIRYGLSESQLSKAKELLYNAKEILSINDYDGDVEEIEAFLKS